MWHEDDCYDYLDEVEYEDIDEFDPDNYVDYNAPYGRCELDTIDGFVCQTALDSDGSCPSPTYHVSVGR